jgi:adenylate cyclase
MRRLWDRLISLGVTPDQPPDLAVALRSTNVAAVMMAGVALAGVGMSLADARSPVLALACALCLALYLCVLFLNGSGFPDAARTGFLVVACTHYILVNVALGLLSGNRFDLIALLLCPAFGTIQTERRLAAAGYAIIGISFVTSESLTRRFGPLITLSPAELERANYFVLFMLSGVVGFAVRYYKNLSMAARRQLDEANRRVAELLANVLPPLIALRLQQQDGVIADSHGEATVLFADLVGFSALTRRLTPGHLIEVLNLIFSRFDEAATGHRIEKIKTIGDCYMAATGVLSEADGATAVESVADFGLDLLRIVKEIADEIGIPLGVRVGISTGPVVSGVIGKQKYSFDIWGDTVNLASRMQSAGVAGRIQVSEGTYWRLQHAFEFETRGVISLKGTESASAYLLIGRKPTAATAMAQP